MGASEIYAKRLNAKEVLTMSGEKFIFPIADGTVKLSGGDQVLRTSTLIRDRPDRGEDQGNLRGDQTDLLQPHFETHRGVMVKLGMISGPFSGNFVYRHHVEPRVKLYVPREASFPIPLKYIDVTRTTSSSLDVMLEKYRRLLEL